MVNSTKQEPLVMFITIILSQRSRQLDHLQTVAPSYGGGERLV